MSTGDTNHTRAVLFLDTEAAMANPREALSPTASLGAETTHQAFVLLPVMGGRTSSLLVPQYRYQVAYTMPKKVNH